MLEVGKPYICAERDGLLRQGAITPVLEEDHVAHAWLQRLPGKDFLLTELRSKEGTVFFLGRIRNYADAATRTGPWDDEKEIFQLAVSKDAIPDDAKLKELREVPLQIAKENGFHKLREVKINGGAQRFVKLLNRAMRKAGWRTTDMSPVFHPEDPEPEKN
jgi:hypothetical protein